MKSILRFLAKLLIVVAVVLVVAFILLGWPNPNQGGAWSPTNQTVPNVSEPSPPATLPSGTPVVTGSPVVSPSITSTSLPTNHASGTGTTTTAPDSTTTPLPSPQPPIHVVVTECVVTFETPTGNVQWGGDCTTARLYASEANVPTIVLEGSFPMTTDQASLDAEGVDINQ